MSLRRLSRVEFLPPSSDRQLFENDAESAIGGSLDNLIHLET
jgi:hypothetical protein